MSQTILVTGGLGYIGSHICVELFHNLFSTNQLSTTKILILDNLTNCSPKVKPIYLNFIVIFSFIKLGFRNDLSNFEK